MINVPQRLQHYANLVRFDRPIGTYLLLWPTLWAVWMASHGQPSANVVVLFVSGVIVMRALGSGINDIIDRNIDCHVARTVERPLAMRQITLFEAIVICSVLALLAMVLLLQLNRFAQLLALIASMFVICYPFTKRFFQCPQLVLAVTFSFGILIAFAHIQHTLTISALLLFFAHGFMTVAYDTIYALCDRDDDLLLGIHSSAIWFGRWDRTIIALCHAMVLVLFLLIGFINDLNRYFYLFCGFSSITLVYQHWLIKDYNAQRCLQAFKNNHITGLLLFLGIFLGTM